MGDFSGLKSGDLVFVVNGRKRHKPDRRLMLASVVKATKDSIFLSDGKCYFRHNGVENRASYPGDGKIICALGGVKGKAVDYWGRQKMHMTSISQGISDINRYVCDCGKSIFVGDCGELQDQRITDFAVGHVRCFDTGF